MIMEKILGVDMIMEVTQLFWSARISVRVARGIACVGAEVDAVFLHF